MQHKVADRVGVSWHNYHTRYNPTTLFTITTLDTTLQPYSNRV